MKEASSELEELVEKYCEVILKAQNEEEVELLNQQLEVSLKEMGFSDEFIQIIFAKTEEMLENQEVNTSIGMPQNILNENGTVFMGSGIALSALISFLAFKKHILNRHKDDDRKL